MKLPLISKALILAAVESSSPFTHFDPGRQPIKENSDAEIFRRMVSGYYVLYRVRLLFINSVHNLFPCPPVAQEMKFWSSWDAHMFFLPPWVCSAVVEHANRVEAY